MLYCFFCAKGGTEKGVIFAIPIRTLTLVAVMVGRILTTWYKRDGKPNHLRDVKALKALKALKARF